MTETATGVLIKYITKEQIIEAISEAVLLHGEKKNPRTNKIGSNVCVYQKEEPESDENANCIVGYVALKFGWPIPNEETVCGASGAARELDWPVDDWTRNWLDRVQCIFDGIQTGEGPDLDRTWVEAYSILQEQNWAVLEEA